MSELFLVHHGIKGQQWGVQNGPPYPLDGTISKKQRNYSRKEVQNVSTDELRYIVSRLKLEQDYMTLKSGKFGKRADRIIDKSLDKTVDAAYSVVWDSKNGRPRSFE